MRFILTTLIAIFLTFTAAAQSPIFEFECFSNANMTGDSCDICVGTSFQSRSFNGLMVYRLGVFNRWIDEPYLIRLRPGNSVEFIEQIGTNPDRITIPLNQTGFSTISGFIDSTFCAGANVDFSFFASDSLRTTAINYLDTIKIVGRGGTTVFFDTLTQKYIITSPASSGGTNLSFTGSSSPVALNSSTGTDVNFVAGTSISLAATGTDLTITNTAPNINQTISTTGAAGNITLSNGGGTLNLNVNDADASTTNELQNLSLTGQALGISSGTGVTLPIIGVTNGAGITTSTAAGVATVTAVDQSASNELQNLSLTGQSLGISSGTGVTLPLIGVAAGTGVSVSTASGVTTVTNTGDLSNTNEIQALSYSAPNLSLSLGGGSVAIPQGTVTSVSVTPTNGVTASVATSTTTPNISIGLGAITPTSVNASGTVTGSNLSGTNTGNQTLSYSAPNLSLSGGGGTVAIPQGTVTGTGTANKVAYWNSATALTATTNFPFDGTSLAVGRSTAGAGRFNVTGNSTSVGLQVDAGTLPDFGATVQMRSDNASQTIYGIDAEGNTGGSSNYINKFYNTGTGSSLLQLGAGTGDAVVQYNITGGGATWSEGIDNSDADKFKIQPTSAIGGVSTGLTITTAGLFGINNQSPLASIDMDLTTDGIALSSGNTANRPIIGLHWLRYNSSMSGLETRTTSSTWHVLNSSQSVLLGAGLGLGTTPTITVNNGTEMAYTVSLTVGTAPTANATIYTRTLANTWSVAPTVVFSAANQITASEITKFYVDTQTTGQYTIRANGTLTTGQTYKLNVILRN